jgi:hypothetical protein
MSQVQFSPPPGHAVKDLKSGPSFCDVAKGSEALLFEDEILNSTSDQLRIEMMGRGNGLTQDVTRLLEITALTDCRIDYLDASID